MHTSSRLSFLASLVVLAACSAEPATTTESAPADVRASATASDPLASANPAKPDAPVLPPPAAEPYVPAREPEFGFESSDTISDEALADYHVVLACAVGGEDVGSITLDLWSEAAPITVRNFLRLCDEGFYDGITFHRIMRNFMVQGGDPTGTGSGNSPHGVIEAELSSDAERSHVYGVVSMARQGGNPNSASCQFFICCDESPAVWNLDGQYASFGRMTGGVAALEALASVETGGREGSTPSAEVTIVRVEVRKGPAPAGDETIARPEPEPDLGGAPAHVAVQHVLVSFNGVPQLQVTRSQEDAQTLAEDLLAKAKAGEDFAALVRANSDDPVRDDDPAPGVYRLLNEGVRNRTSERNMFELNRRFQEDIGELQAQQQAGTLTPEEFQEQGMALQKAARAGAAPFLWRPRDEMVPAFGDVAFSLEVGEVGMAAYDAEKSPFGWHIIKRIE